MSILDEYELLIRLVTVKDFARPIWGEIDVDEPVFNKYSEFMHYCDEHFLDEVDNIFLITRDGVPIGYAIPEPPSNDKGKDQMLPIIPPLMISSDTSLIDVVSIFANEKMWNNWWKLGWGNGECLLGNRYLFVLSGNQITHIVQYEYLLGLPLRMILFSLIMSLESRILMSLHKDARKSIGCLSPKRLEKAQDTCNTRKADREVGSYSPHDILESTTFIDRCEMLVKLDPRLKKLPFPSKAKARTFFKHLENMRNDIAHSRVPAEIVRNPYLLDQILSTLRNCLKTMSKK